MIQTWFKACIDATPSSRLLRESNKTHLARGQCRGLRGGRLSSAKPMIPFDLGGLIFPGFATSCKARIKGLGRVRSFGQGFRVEFRARDVKVWGAQNSSLARLLAKGKRASYIDFLVLKGEWGE